MIAIITLVIVAGQFAIVMLILWGESLPAPATKM